MEQVTTIFTFHNPETSVDWILCLFTHVTQCSCFLCLKFISFFLLIVKEKPVVTVTVSHNLQHLVLSFAADSMDPDLDMSGPVLNHLEQVTTVSAQLHTDEGQNGLTQEQTEARNGSMPGRWRNLADSSTHSPLSSRTLGAAYLYSPSSHPLTYSGPLRILWKKDRRSEVFVKTFVFWLDTAEMVRVAGEPTVFYTAWVFPIYIFAFLSTLRMIITPHSPLLSFAGVALQDFSFFIIRVALIAKFHFVTPVLYPMKNFLVSVSFIYFTMLTKLRIFRKESMF